MGLVSSLNRYRVAKIENDYIDNLDTSKHFPSSVRE
jgi:hypothetical protein